MRAVRAEASPWCLCIYKVEQCYWTTGYCDWLTASDPGMSVSVLSASFKRSEIRRRTFWPMSYTPFLTIPRIDLDPSRLTVH